MFQVKLLLAAANTSWADSMTFRYGDNYRETSDTTLNFATSQEHSDLST